MSESEDVVLRRLRESEIGSQSERAILCRGCESERELGCEMVESEIVFVCVCALFL